MPEPLPDPAARRASAARREPGALRVGFVTQLLWERYGPFWRDLVAGAGAAPVFASREQVEAALEQLADVPIPGAAFRLAAAQALALADCDLVVLPRLNPESSSARGSAQERWVADLPGAVADAVGALSSVQAVAAYPDPELETDAVRLLQRLLGDRAAVPRVWSRHRAAAERQASPGGGSSRSAAVRGAAGSEATALVAQPWLLTGRVERALLASGERLVTQLALEPERCREEGWRVDERLIATDAEVLGAARMLSRRAGVRGVRFLLDEESASDDWLLRRLTQLLHKPVEPLPWREALGAEGLFDALLHLPVD